MGNSGDDGSSVQSRTDLERPVRTGGGDADAALQPGTVLAGRYEVRQTIGRGGTGLVVEAFDRMLGVAVAIKILRAEYAGERGWSERLAREVKLARQIHHPNVCRVFDYAQSEGRAFLIMELAGGGTLRDEIVAGTTAARPLADRIADARAIAAGLAAIHAAGIVHRDIAPQNALRMSDGRLILSDFGLATDSFDGLTSIHGGTIAYMAPEVVGGGRASFASDIWALGMVIHETVFGERLRWDAAAGELRSAIASRKAGRLKASLLEICRACLTPNPERRPSSAAEIALRLSEAGLARSAVRRRLQRAAALVVGAVLVAASFVGVRRVGLARRRASPPVATATPVDPLMIIPTGEPDDWTDKSKVLAEIPERIRCMVPLPDHHTVRFVWGYPPRSEDLDTRTGKRTPSPLVPDAYAEGCPDLTRDGKKLVYTGHTPDDRAFAFVSPHPDGRDAVPVVPIAEPSMASDPTWMPDGETFSYDVDQKHMAVFSTVTRRSLVLPDGSGPVFAGFRGSAADQLLVGAVSAIGGTSLSAYSFPALSEVFQFHVPFLLLDVTSLDARTYYCSVGQRAARAPLIRVDPIGKRARFSGAIDDQLIRYPFFLEDGLAFSSIKVSSTLVRDVSASETSRLKIDHSIRTAASCGDGIVATHLTDRGPTIVMLDVAGTIVGTRSEAGTGVLARCSPAGDVLYVETLGQAPALERCKDGRCRVVKESAAGAFALSPDGSRIAYLRPDNRGLVAAWIVEDGRGGEHEVTVTDAACSPGWSTDKHLWVALRRRRQVVWTEFDTDAGRPTGRTSLGTRDCADGVQDPASPVQPSVRLEFDCTSEVRLLGAKYLPADQ